MTSQSEIRDHREQILSETTRLLADVCNMASRQQLSDVMIQHLSQSFVEKIIDIQTGGNLNMKTLKDHLPSDRNEPTGYIRGYMPSQ